MMQTRGVWIWGCGLSGLLAPMLAAAALRVVAPSAPSSVPAPMAVAEKLITHGSFEHVPVLLPKGDAQRVVLWFAGDKRGEADRMRQVEALRQDGAMVAVIDSAHLQAVLTKNNDKCGFSFGDVENLSRYLQADFQVPTYHLPLLVGDGDGAAVAYALASQAPKHELAGLLTEDFCPTQVRYDRICGAGVKLGVHALKPSALSVPWLAAIDAQTQDRCRQQSDAFVQQVPQARQFRLGVSGDALPGLLAAVRSLGARPGVSLPPIPVDLAGLPVVEVPVTPAAVSAGNANVFAIFVSGDGGWAWADQHVAGALAEAGIPVVGIDSLRYFWSERTPQGIAADLDRIYRHYSGLWKREKVVLIGFSQGADVLPAAYNRLPAPMRDQVRLTALLSLDKKVDYEFHVSSWISSRDDDGLPIVPELTKMPPAQTMCIYGEDDDDTLCPRLPKGAVQLVKLPGDHHFKGDYATVAKEILQRVN
nr:AcvB/VirJ family lysyl-phosphatidylglycerol hydrolase [Xanthomonas albilineans]